MSEVSNILLRRNKQISFRISDLIDIFQKVYKISIYFNSGHYFFNIFKMKAIFNTKRTIYFERFFLFLKTNHSKKNLIKLHSFLYTYLSSYTYETNWQPIKELQFNSISNGQIFSITLFVNYLAKFIRGFF